mmetsp:Transcript_2133/g.8489  ORF Transcript_2133/g.8489 Transcript_2133/m.8489 type:complete len:209 (-) Transcript_2133:478-1104(-)
MGGGAALAISARAAPSSRGIGGSGSEVGGQESADVLVPSLLRALIRESARAAVAAASSARARSSASLRARSSARRAAAARFRAAFRTARRSDALRLLLSAPYVTSASSASLSGAAGRPAGRAGVPPADAAAARAAPVGAPHGALRAPVIPTVFSVTPGASGSPACESHMLGQAHAQHRPVRTRRKVMLVRVLRASDSAPTRSYLRWGM